MEARATSFFLLPPFNLTLNHEWWVIHIFAFSDLYIVWPWFFFSEGELLRVLADLHGGDRTHEEVVLEYEEIKQQVTICTTCKIFNYKIEPIFFLLSVGLLRAHSRSEILHGLIETGKPLSRHARDVLANVVPTLWYEHHDARPPEVMVDRLG